MANTGSPERTGGFHPTAYLGMPKGLLAAAEEGDVRAMVKVAESYYNGSGGFPQESLSAFVWFERAAERGDTEAMFRTAEMLRWGNGRLANLKEAELWYRRAADKGHAKAQEWLVHAYHTGDGVERDPDEALAHMFKPRAVARRRSVFLTVAGMVAGGALVYLALTLLRR
jgi:TPR repeat protein